MNEYLTRWHLDQARLRRQPPAVRFQAERSNDCWQFDMSTSDLKRIEARLAQIQIVGERYTPQMMSLVQRA